MDIAHELRDCAIRTYPELVESVNVTPRVAAQIAYLLRDCRDETFVVGDDNDTSVPSAESSHECIETLGNISACMKDLVSMVINTSISKWLVGYESTKSA